MNRSFAEGKTMLTLERAHAQLVNGYGRLGGRVLLGRA